MPEPTTCWTLVRDAATGDLEARDAFARRYRPVVRAYLEARWRGRLDGHDLEDALQEVFLECFRSDGVLEKSADGIASGFRAFLFGAVRNVALRVEQRRHRQLDRPGPDELAAEALAAEEASQSRAFDRAWARSVLDEAVQLQAERAAERGTEARARAEILELRFGEGLKLAAIARRLDLAPETLYREYELACREFEAALRVVVLNHRPGAPEDVLRTCRELLALIA